MQEKLTMSITVKLTAIKNKIFVIQSKHIINARIEIVQLTQKALIY